MARSETRIVVPAIPIAFMGVTSFALAGGRRRVIVTEFKPECIAMDCERTRIANRLRTAGYPHAAAAHSPATEVHITGSEVPISHRPASADKVDDEDYHGQNQQEVNETSSDVQAEAE
jgi:hypothetical protein